MQMPHPEKFDHSEAQTGANSLDTALSARRDALPATSGTRWLKIDFHLHANEDPLDELDHSAIDLLHRAHALGFGALALTLHNHVLTKREVFDTARELGLLLIPAAEMRLEGSDVVIVNLTAEEAQGLRRFQDLTELRRRRGHSIFIFAPHPFYLMGGSIGSRRLMEYIDLFDAIELCHFYTRWLNPNRAARRAAATFQKPLLATSDTHRLDFFGDHYTLVNLPRSPGIPQAEAIFHAIRAGLTRTVSPPWPLGRFLRYTWWIFAEHEIRLIQAKLGQ